MIEDVVTSELKRLTGKKVREQHHLRKVGGYSGELKKSPFKKFADVFFEEDLPTVRRDLLREVIIPTIKDFMADIFIGAVERTLYGSSGSSRRKSSRRTMGSKRVSSPSYASYYEGKIARDPEVPFDEDFTFKEIVMRDRASATDLLKMMRDAIEEYGNISVAELYESLDKESLNFADNYYGWTDLSKAQIRRVNTGYRLDLPKPVQLR